MAKLSFDSNKLLNVKFTKNVKGYDAYQVDVTFDKIIEDYRFYESFYDQAKEYISKLEKDVGKQKDTIHSLEIEVAKYKKRFEGIPDNVNVTSENINLLKKIAAYEKVLYQHGIDPKKIK